MIKQHTSWSVMDSSKIKNFMQCPRKFFYRYLLGWTSRDKKQDLVFGQAWHDAREVTLLEGMTEEGLAHADNAFMKTYRKDFNEMTDDSYYPKSPVVVIPTLIAYAKRYKGDNFKVLHTEVAGTVGVDDNRKLAFRIDAICEDERGIFIFDHKTSKKMDKAWGEQWILDLSLGTYSHVLHMLYPKDRHKIYGVIVDGAFFRKKGIDFLRQPVRLSESSMNVWWWNVLHWLDMIDWETRRLMEDCKVEDGIMMAFPMRTTECTKYGLCMYHDFCGAWHNPLQYCDSPPQGFVEEWWDPSNREKTAKVVKHITYEGEVK